MDGIKSDLYEDLGGGRPLTGEEKRHADLLKANMRRKEEGNGHFKGENYENAIKVFREAYLDVSKIPWSESSKDYKDAMQLLEALRLNLAASHTKLGNFERALEFCNRAIELRKPDENAKAFYRRAMAYEGLHNFEAAQADLKRANALQRGGDIEKALERVNAALEAKAAECEAVKAARAEKDRKKKQKQRKKQEAEAARVRQLVEEKKSKELEEEDSCQRRAAAAEEADKQKKLLLEQEAREAREAEDLKRREEQRAADKRRAAEEKARKKAEEKLKQEIRESKRREKQLQEARAYELALQKRAQELEQLALQERLATQRAQERRTQQSSSVVPHTGAREDAARERQRQVLVRLQKDNHSLPSPRKREGNGRPLMISATSGSSVVDSRFQAPKDNGRPYTPPLATSSPLTAAPQNLFPHLFPGLNEDQTKVAGSAYGHTWESSPSTWDDGAAWYVPEDAGAPTNWNITGQDEQGCVICMEQEKNALLLPCGHLSACMQCIDMVKKSSKPLCPICRQAIEDVIQVN